MLTDQPVVGEPAEISVVDQERPAGGRDAHELALVGAADLGKGAHQVVAGDHQLGGEPQVGECADQHRHQLLNPARPAVNSGGKVGRCRTVNGDQLVRGVQVVAVDYL